MIWFFGSGRDIGGTTAAVDIGIAHGRGWVDAVITVSGLREGGNSAFGVDGWIRGVMIDANLVIILSRFIGAFGHVFKFAGRSVSGYADHIPNGAASKR